MSDAPAIVWFRLDLRLADQWALDWARRRGGPVIPVFIRAPDEEAPWQPGAASRWWLHHSLQHLAVSLAARGSRLVLRHGPSADALAALVRESGATAVAWTRRFEPAAVARDRAVAQRLRAAGIEVFEAGGSLLFEPEAVTTKDGRWLRKLRPPTDSRRPRRSSS